MSLANDSPYYQKYIEDAFGRDRLNWYDLSPQNFEWSQLTPEYTEHEQHEDSSTNTTNTQMPHARRKTISIIPREILLLIQALLLLKEDQH